MPSDARQRGASTEPRASRPAEPRSRPLGRRVWTLGRLLVLAAALAATYGIFFLAALRVATKAREVEVPDLRGLSVDDATASLAGVGLVVRLDPARRSDPAVPADHVLSQDPAAGAVLRRQQSVRIRLSDGQRAFIVPQVVGQAERAAEIALAQEGIEVSARAAIRTSDAEYGLGSVVAQNPPATSQSPTVALLVNRGEGGLSYVMPDLIGTLGVRAAEALRTRGFRVAITAEHPYPGLPPGIVIRQTPQPGFQIGFAEPISIEVSR